MAQTDRAPAAGSLRELIGENSRMQLSLDMPGLNEPYRSLVPLEGETIAEVFEHYLTQSEDRKSTRLNSSHVRISYAVFCLKKKSQPSPILICVRVCSNGSAPR